MIRFSKVGGIFFSSHEIKNENTSKRRRYKKWEKRRCFKAQQCNKSAKTPHFLVG
jgi:hypothetical protein